MYKQGAWNAIKLYMGMKNQGFINRFPIARTSSSIIAITSKDHISKSYQSYIYFNFKVLIVN